MVKVKKIKEQKVKRKASNKDILNRNTSLKI